MKATIEVIAKKCGVSKATVSYVLNNKKTSLGLSAQTIDHVLKVSRELDYRPDLVAVALAEKKKRPLSLLVLTPWLYAQFSDFMVQVYSAMKDFAEYNPLKTVYEVYEQGHLNKGLNGSKCEKFDAVMVIGTGEKDHQYLIRNRSKLPNVVLLNRKIPDYPCAAGNDGEAAAELAERVAASSFYENYVVAFPNRPSFCEQERVCGFVRALKKTAGITAIQHRIESALPPETALQKLLAERDGKKTLFFLPQYHPAAQMMELALRQGIRIPDEIGIVAYDLHSMLKNFLHPALTTIDPQIGRMTGEALRLACAVKNGEKAEGRITEGIFESGESAIHI